jgi:hypothetical protein
MFDVRVRGRSHNGYFCVILQYRRKSKLRRSFLISLSVRVTSNTDSITQSEPPCYLNQVFGNSFRETEIALFRQLLLPSSNYETQESLYPTGYAAGASNCLFVAIFQNTCGGRRSSTGATSETCFSSLGKWPGNRTAYAVDGFVVFF